MTNEAKLRDWEIMKNEKPNDRNRKKEKGFENLNFGNLNLFRIWDLGFRICRAMGKANALQLHIVLPAEIIRNVVSKMSKSDRWRDLWK